LLKGLNGSSGFDSHQLTIKQNKTKKGKKPMKQTITIEITDEEYNAFRSALLLHKSHPAFENQLDYTFDAEVVAVRSLFDKVMIARQTQVNGHNVDANKCHSCMRPFKKLTNEQRARTNVGTGHEKEVAKSLNDMGNACRKVHELLEFRRGNHVRDGWVSRDELSKELNGGDGARRVRQLRDEFAIPIEVEMRVAANGSRQAYYRIAKPQGKTLWQLAQEGAFGKE